MHNTSKIVGPEISDLHRVKDEPHSVMTSMHFEDEDLAIWGLLAAGPAVWATQTSGEEGVASAISTAIAPYQKGDGSFDLQNEFRFIIAKKASLSWRQAFHHRRSLGTRSTIRDRGDKVQHS